MNDAQNAQQDQPSQNIRPVADNPLLVPSTLPYGLPDFAAISDEHVIPAFRTAFVDHEAEIAAIIANPETPTFENTIEAMEKSGRMLERVAAYFFNVAGTDATDERMAIETVVAPEVAAHLDSIRLNKELWERIKQVAAPTGDDADSAEARRLLDKIRRQFQRAGADLDDVDKKRLRELNSRLSQLSTAFGENLLNTTNDLAVEINDEAELDGLSPSAKDSLARYAKKSDKECGWLIPLDLPTAQPILADLKSPATRAKVYEASRARGGDANADIVLEMVQLRAERARLLGYDTHADYVIADETAGSAAAAKKLLTDLAPAAVANAEGEYKRVADLAADAGEAEVTAADWPYWAQLRRADEFAVDEEELRQYFQLDRVMEDGVFYAANQLYGITMTRRDDLTGYAPGTTVWEVTDAGDAGIGLIITDYYSRPTKRGGAWMSSFMDQSRLLDTRPVVVNVLNIAEPAEGEQALLTMDEVITLFHEFGHALHGLLSDVRYPTFSGTNVPRDFVEFPSQINENWALEPSILNNYAFHADTGELIRDELVAKVKTARTAGEGFATVEYLGASAIDLAWHSLTLEQAQAVATKAESQSAMQVVAEFEREALEDYRLVVEHLTPRYTSTYFNHIFAGGYSAGYYSYLWAEVLDADGFGWFADNGGATRTGGERFRDLILSRGGSIDYTEAYRNFRGRDKDIRPLLERRGLVGTAG
ncbi:M3 family metallopeptidase [Corynebacterium sp. H113]|uniref:M3 family metallopeptidase n=1 Tax=Corynebacterium sp. H113 TaxID=3133419 RepID=UPI00309F7D6E